MDESEGFISENTRERQEGKKCTEAEKTKPLEQKGWLARVACEGSKRGWEVMGVGDWKSRRWSIGEKGGRVG